MIVIECIIGAHVPTVATRRDVDVASLFLENIDFRNLEKSAPKKSKLTAVISIFLPTFHFVEVKYCFCWFIIIIFIRCGRKGTSIFI